MTLANGRGYLAIPGPSVVPDAVLRAMHRAAPNIYTGELVEITESLFPDLRRIARTEGQVAAYICNGHGAWEAALANVLSPGDTVLVLATGTFCEGWGVVARGLGALVETLDFGRHAPIEPARVTERLKQDRSGSIKAVLAVQVDTSTGVLNDIAALRGALDDAGHGALLMVDCIACLACDRFEMDAWGVDVMVAASQKGLMTPPGMGFVFYGSRADAARETAACATRYWDWRPRTRPEAYYEFFAGTAPTHHVYGLRAALDMILAEGIEAVWSRHQRLAQAIWAACDAWGQGGPLEINISDRAARSRAVTTVRLGPPDAVRLRAWTESRAGLTLGLGIGMQGPEDPGGEGWFRIGHMGHVNAHMVLGALGCIEAGLKALGIAHGAGALSAAAEVVAGA